jgi:hypothetical protein
MVEAPGVEFGSCRDDLPAGERVELAAATVVRFVDHSLPARKGLTLAQFRDFMVAANELMACGLDSSRTDDARRRRPELVARDCAKVQRRGPSIQ